jgi:hypothetical protein
VAQRLGLAPARLEQPGRVEVRVGE